MYSIKDSASLFVVELGVCGQVDTDFTKYFRNTFLKFKREERLTLE